MKGIDLAKEGFAPTNQPHDVLREVKTWWIGSRPCLGHTWKVVLCVSSITVQHYIKLSASGAE